MNSLYLEHLTWVEAETAFRDIPTVLLPIGAILKEHGPHLPLNTDYLLARDLARRVAEQTPVIVCPPITFGYYPANIAELGHAADGVLESKVGSHANEHETSMLLAIDASVVKMENAAPEIHPWMLRRSSPVREPGPLYREPAGVTGYAPSGVTGDPTRATAEKGEAILTAMAADVIAFCKEWQ